MGCGIADFGNEFVGGRVRRELKDRMVGVSAVNVDFNVGWEIGVEYAGERVGDLTEGFVSVDWVGKSS